MLFWGAEGDILAPAIWPAWPSTHLDVVDVADLAVYRQLQLFGPKHDATYTIHKPLVYTKLRHTWMVCSRVA